MTDEIVFEPEDYHYSTRSTAARLPPNQVDFGGRIPLLEELQRTLDTWNGANNQSTYDPLPTLTRVAELVEESYDEFLKMDPDPLDDRHPHRTHPHSSFGNLLKALFRNNDFMNKLTISYLLGRDRPELSVAAARVLLDCVPGLDSAVIFSEPEDFVPQLYHWASASDNELLQAYSIGLLSASLEVQENASKHRALNSILIPIALRRLRTLREQMEKERSAEITTATSTSAPVSFENMTYDDDKQLNGKHKEPESSTNSGENSRTGGDSNDSKHSTGHRDSRISFAGCTPMRIQKAAAPPSSPPRKKRKLEALTTNSASFGSLQDLENSCSRWDLIQPYVIGKHKIFPLTIEMHQRLILQFLGPTGEYQDLLSLTYEGQAMDQVMYYIDLQKTRDVRLTFDALRYLTSLLVHRKFALEFVSRGGVEALLRVPTACMASVGVSNCLYYLSYNEDVMEKVCQLDDKVLDDLVDYCIWCLEHSYESGMASASMFFTHGFFYKAILDRFDKKKGIRVLYNYVSTLSILHDIAGSENFDLTEEQMHTSTQTVRNASAAFRSYVAAHLYVKLVNVRKHMGSKSLLSGCSYPETVNVNLPSHKAMFITDEALHQGVSLLGNLLRVLPNGWYHIEEACKMGLTKAMFSIVICAPNWNQTSGKTEMARNALEVLYILSCLPSVQEEFCLTYSTPDDSNQGTGYLVGLAEGVLYEDSPEIQLAALRIIINCIYVQDSVLKIFNKMDEKMKKLRAPATAQQLNAKELLEKMWTTFRHNNILMLLTTLIYRKTPLTEADRIRAIACRAMLGMARCEPVRQIISSLPLIANNELQGMMKDPIAQDQRLEHQLFCKASKELIEKVTQKSIADQIPNPKDLSQERLWKSHIVSNTKITYNETELLQLIHGHLMEKGLSKTAEQLLKEANLPDVPASRLNSTPAWLEPLPHSSSDSTPQSRRTLFIESNKDDSTPGPSTSTSSMDFMFATPNTPRVRRQKSSVAIPRRLTLKPSASSKGGVSNNEIALRPVKGLDGIITDYFRTEHSLCNNPVTTCPPFSLFYPHHCPEPKNTGVVPYNVVKRFMDRPVLKRGTEHLSRVYDERFVFSRFRPTRIVAEHDELYTCCAYSIDDEHLIVGMFNGDVHWMNIETGMEESHTSCHTSGITAIVPSRDGEMLLTSSAFIHPLSSLWRLKETQEHMYDLENEYYVQFANFSQDRIVGNHADTATIYDTDSGRAISVFCKEGLNTRYIYNKAAFSPCDTMIMNDGILWDVRDSTKPINIFDRMNDKNGGTFHPHGNHVIINSEIWDLRTYRLLRTVPALDQTKILFNQSGNIMYSVTYVDPTDNDDTFKTFGSSFRTFDSSDYSVITTVDCKKTLLDVACDHSDRYISVIERIRTQSSQYYDLNHDESVVRTFEIGKRRDAEDDADEGEDDDEENENNDSDSDSDSGTDISDLDMNSGDEDNVFNNLERVINGGSDASSTSMSSSDEEFDDRDDDDDEDDDNDEDHDGGSSGGWETASNQDDDNEDNFDDGFSGSEGERGGDDGEHEQDEQVPMEDAHPSSSTTALNPRLRRQGRRQ